MFVLLAMQLSCSADANRQILPLVGKPPGKMSPWIEQLIWADSTTTEKALKVRFASQQNSLKPLVDRLLEYRPEQITFSDEIGYLKCVRLQTNDNTSETNRHVLYIAQPLSDELMLERLEHFDFELRPIMRDFFERFAGCGEEMEGQAGQFTYRVWPKASDFGIGDEESNEYWRDSRVLYAAMNGDSVLIAHDGSTAWHILETNEIVSIAKTFDEFVAFYARFLDNRSSFDSWSYREHLQ